MIDNLFSYLCKRVRLYTNKAKAMRQLMLYVIFVLSMVLGSHGESEAASRLAHCSKDRLEKVEHKQDTPEAQINDASILAYGVCGHRPQRLSPTGNIYANPSASRLQYNKIRFLSYSLSVISSYCEQSRDETAPICFDVACKYYVICLRHLIC